MEQLGKDVAVARVEPGATKRDIFRYIIREGGYTKEPSIRTFLFQNNGLLNESGVKKHLKTMEADNLIRKDGTPGAANTIYLAAEEPECYHYLCDLIGRSHTDPDIAKDIRDFFTKTNASAESITARMVANSKQHYYDYVVDVLDCEFADKRPQGLKVGVGKRENDRNESRDTRFSSPDDETMVYPIAKSSSPLLAVGDTGLWSVDAETMKIVYLIAARSPSLFAVGSQPVNALFLTLIRALIETRNVPGYHPHEYFKWLISHAIAASLITDLHVYDQYSLLLAEDEKMKGAFMFFNEEFGDLWLFCSQRVKRQFMRKDDGSIDLMGTK